MKRACGEPMRERKSRRSAVVLTPKQLPELQHEQLPELKPDLQHELQSEKLPEQLPELQHELQHEPTQDFFGLWNQSPFEFQLPALPFMPEPLPATDAVDYSPAGPAAYEPPVAHPAAQSVAQPAAQPAFEFLPSPLSPITDAAFYNPTDYSPAGLAARSPPRRSPDPFQIPPDYHHLGDQLLVGATEFCEQVKVHVRRYDFRNGKLVPTRDGVTLTTHRWYLLSEAMDTFDASDPRASRLLERELFLSTIIDSEGRVGGVNVQYAYETSAKTVQLSHASMRMTLDQYRQLVEVRHHVSDCLKGMLYFAQFKKFVQREVLFVEMSDDMLVADAERLLHNSLVSCFKDAIEDVVQGIPIYCRGCTDFSDNQEGHDCQLSLRVQTNFEKALFKLSVKTVAETFVAANQRLHKYITEPFIDGLCLGQILRACFNLFCRPDVDCLMPM